MKSFELIEAELREKYEGIDNDTLIPLICKEVHNQAIDMAIKNARISNIPGPGDLKRITGLENLKL